MALHISTIVSRKSANILAHLARISPRIAGNPLLYSIAATPQTPPSELSEIYNATKALSESSVGCLSAPLPSSLPAWQRYFAVSVASFDAKHATLFRSTIPGRKAIQVGRWRARDQHGKQPADIRDCEQDIEWGSMLGQPQNNSVIPEPLQRFSCVMLPDKLNSTNSFVN